MLDFKKWMPSFRSRTLRIDILTLFLTLFCSAFLCIISFSFYKNYHSILKFSVGTVERVGLIINEKLQALLIDAEQVPKIAADLFTSLEDITPNNKYLISFIYDAVQYDPNFCGFYIGTKEGNLLGATNVVRSGQTQYVSDPKKHLPSNTEYAFLVVNNASKPAKHMIYYKNADLQTIEEEDVSNTLFDPKTRPWYQGSSQDKGYHWTNVYRFYLENNWGISASVPLFSKENEIIGAAVVDLSFFQFSAFLAQQQIGKSGAAFILDQDGNILIAPKKEGATLSLPSDTVSKVYQEYQQQQQNTFLYTHKGIKYLVYINPLTLIKEKKWFITIIVPLSDFYSELLYTQHVVLYLAIGILILSTLMVFLFSNQISSPIVKLAGQIDKIAQFNLEESNRVHSNIKEIYLMDTAIATLRQAIRSFARYVPKNVVKLLIQKGEEVSLGGEKKDITIFFSDIIGFTSIAETSSAEYVMELLSEYYEKVTKIILDNEGTIDKFIGDSLMAFWGAPLDIPQHALKACATALLCKEHFLSFNHKQREKNQQEITTIIVINSGPVIVGNIGTPQRVNYTAIGDVINTAAHLKPACKIYHTIINITEETYKRVKHAVLARPLDIVSVRGKKNKMRIYELLGLKKKEHLSEEELCVSFAEAFEAFHSGQIEQAKTLFESLAKNFPEDIPTQIYLSRLSETK